MDKMEFDSSRLEPRGKMSNKKNIKTYGGFGVKGGRQLGRAPSLNDEQKVSISKPEHKLLRELEIFIQPT